MYRFAYQILLILDEMWLLPLLKFYHNAIVDFDSWNSMQDMSHVMMPVVVKNEGAKNFVLQGLNGWAIDDFSTVVGKVPTFIPKGFNLEV